MSIRIRVRLVGTTPLLMHNPRMVDPEFSINREIKTLTSKRKKTDADLRDIERLEWYGGLYTSNSAGPEVVVQPTSKVRKCLIETAKISRMGKQVERAVSFAELDTPLIYDGPKDIDKLFGDKRFTSRMSVGVGPKRVMRVRPSFHPWSLELVGIFIPDAGLNFEELRGIVELAGVVEGIGDNRRNGYGRFVGTLEEIE
jgi:hypothetical protein